jgi:predicted AlkP superfamily phosphohydrolase/phosphomutase
LGQWVLKLGFGRKAKQMGRAKRESWQRKLFLSLDDVDWSRTTVYCIGNFGQMYVNLQGREPEGCVAPGVERDTVLADLRQRLEQLVDPESGEKIIERMMTRDEVYSGPHSDDAPDLMFFTREMVYKPMGLSDFSSPRVFDAVYGTTGHHRNNGIMIWHAPHIIPARPWQGQAFIYDLAPTILHLLGVAVPTAMDGRVLTELFSDEFNINHPVTYSDDDTLAAGPRSSGYSDQDEDELREMLRALGYVT